MSSPSLSRRPVIPDDVDRIAADSDPVIRNLRITQGYHELSASAAALLGPLANWCTFATWASKQAGRTIRKDDLRRGLEDAVRSSPVAIRAVGTVRTEARRFGATVPLGASQLSVRTIVDPLAALDGASAAVARGNVRVFEEVGREFARFHLAFGTRDGQDPDDPDDPDALARFVEGLRPGDPPNGQRYLRHAFAHYHRARFDPDPVVRAQLVHLANLEIGLHEQTRLQPEIQSALDAGVVDPRQVRDRVLAALFPHSAWLVRARLWFARLIGRRTRLDRAIDTLVIETQRITRRLLTRHLMTIDLSTSVRLRLGEDLGAGFPPSLQRIVVPELRELLDRIDPTPDDPTDSRVTDWADLDDRVHFIAEMFRCFQDSPFLFDPPFDPAQLDRLDAGELPDGPL